MIQIENLVKRFGSKYAVDDISFSIDEGEVVGFLGPNGAGKSTTMNIITGYMSSTSSRIRPRQSASSAICRSSRRSIRT